MTQFTLITGGARSGKSRYALDHLEGPGENVLIATARPEGPEMEKRIQKHRKNRDDSIQTREEPIHLEQQIKDLEDGVNGLLIDCIPVWLGNLMHDFDHEKREQIKSHFLEELDRLDGPERTLIVTAETGMGIVPDHPSGRQFRDELGLFNQKLAAHAKDVIFMVCGIPRPIK